MSAVEQSRLDSGVGSLSPRLGIGFFPSGLEISFLLAGLGFVVWGCALATWRLRAQAEPGVD
ncbi:hypothetical protein BRC60_03060 [Halobacteriales archaeon QH_1_68_42]|nr:MAG: hypothetical protein BRC60_03060 [Halobacteriales archaeon QH_1_68_42]